MKAAAFRLDITPPIGLPIGGNIRDDNRSRGIHDPLFCKIILVSQADSLVCFLGLDLLGLQFGHCQLIKAGIADRTRIGKDQIVINSTHTHSGPDLVDFFKETIDSDCEAYVQDIAVRIADCAVELQDRLAPVTARIGRTAITGLSFNRRLVMKDGSMRMNWEDVPVEAVDHEAGPIDPELQVLSFWAGPCPMAAIVNFTLHPAVLVGKDFLWARDYVHDLDCSLQASFGSDLVMLFANGAEGNVNHLNYHDLDQDRGFSETRRIGGAIGLAADLCFRQARELRAAEIRCLSRMIDLPLRQISDQDVAWADEVLRESRGVPSLLDGVPDEIYAREILKLAGNREKVVQTEIQVVTIGNVAIATLPGEVFVEFGLQIKAASTFCNTLVFGLANDCLGYIPTAAAFAEGGYEIKTASSSKMDPQAGRLLTAAVCGLLSEARA